VRTPRTTRGRRLDDGFTLVELLAVLAIIGLLAAIAIPLFLNQQHKGWTTAAKVDLRNLVSVQQEYYADHNSYATSHQLAAELTYRTSANGLAAVLWSSSSDFCIATANKNGPADPSAPFAGYGYPYQTFFFDSRVGTITTTACTAPGGATGPDGGYWDATGAH
jgi:prepilin-type N-terminal cleavage/methylation domain-containing protein